jgi:ABC-type multidrug transport system ATPase subunit
MLVMDDITKLYENNRGIKNFSIEAQNSEIIAILGPNGSGKSTTLKIIAGILKPDKGECTILKYNTIECEAKKYIGYLPDEPFLYENLSPIQFLSFVQSMKGIEDVLYCENLLKELDLWEFRNQPLRTFSFGMKKKVAFISAIMNTPKLLILDEPTNGLDTKSILIMKKHISELKRKGSIIIISSHILEFISKIADKIIFINNGNLVKAINCNNNYDLEQIYTEIYL